VSGDGQRAPAGEGDAVDTERQREPEVATLRAGPADRLERAGYASRDTDDTDDTDDDATHDDAPDAGPDSAPPPSSGPISMPSGTAQTLAFGAVSCTSCGKENHALTPHCVFCGQALTRDAPRSSSRARSLEPADGPSAVTSRAAGGHAPVSADGPRTRPASWTSQASGRSFASSAQTEQDHDEELDVSLPIADPLIGAVVAERYRIVEGIGRGGMGIVYRVEHTRIGKLLALKLLAGELSRNPEVVRRFKQEALTASKLSSPNTVQVFDYGQDGGLTYLVMELVTGEDLGKVLRRDGPMAFDELGAIVVQVCSSLAEAHSHGIVHRDIKPENVMLVQRGRGGRTVAKVLDFGLAKLREGPELNEVTSQGAIVGTPYFMSPEQVRGEAVDARSDVYSIGALMYRALTGHYPHAGPSPMAVFTKHLTEEPAPPSSRAPEQGLSAGIDRIVMRALAKSPAERFARVEELQAAVLEELRAQGSSRVDELLDSTLLRKMSAERTSGPTPGPALATRDELEHYERSLKRKGRAWMALGGCLAVAGLVVAGRYLLLHRARPFSGLEVEPNDALAEATPVPFGRAVSGFVGRRPEPSKGDRDAFAIEVPTVELVSLSLRTLPNFPLCVQVHRAGALAGHYCTGLAGRDLRVPALRLEPGPVVLTVQQDLDGYGGATPPLHENVSDAYTLTLEASRAEPDLEREPNDEPSGATMLGARGTPEGTRRGALAWARDEDVVCVERAATQASPVRLRVHDETRDGGTVLEATLLVDGLEGPPVRVHTSKPLDQKIDPSRGDVVGDLVTEPLSSGSQTCVRLRAARDPWTLRDDRKVPPGSQVPWRVEVIGADEAPSNPPAEPSPKPTKPKK
jgi:serine/threonine protein kinase